MSNNGLQSVEKVRITPSKARAMIEASDYNFRKTVDALVAKYAIDMKSGNWEFNGSTIVVDKSGNVIDGNHRLRGCVRADKPFDTLIVTGNIPDGNIDGGRPRTITEYLRRKGVHQAAVVGTVLRVVYTHESGTHALAANHGRTASRTQLLEVLDVHPEIPEAVARFFSTFRQFRRPSIMTALLYIFSTIDEPMAVTLWEVLIDKISWEPHDDCAVLLRSKLRKEKISATYSDNETQMALTIKVWNAWRTGVRLKSLGYRVIGPGAERFPKISK